MDFAQQILDAGSIKLDFGYKLKVLSERLSQCTSFLHFFLCRPASIRLSTLHSIRIRLLTLALDLWKGKHLGLATLQTFPHEQVIPICPHQRSDPWLHIPSQIQRRALHIGDAPRRIRDLVFRRQGRGRPVSCSSQKAMTSWRKDRSGCWRILRVLESGSTAVLSLCARCC